MDLYLSGRSAFPKPLSPIHSLYWQLQLEPETNAVFRLFPPCNFCELVHQCLTMVPIACPLNYLGYNAEFTLDLCKYICPLVTKKSKVL